MKGGRREGKGEKWEGREAQLYANICGTWDKRFETILCRVLASVLEV